jgi:ribosomal protein S18 acetylase RimI-like enzyme
MSIEIRKASENDFTSIHGLVKEFATFIETPEKVTITVEQMIQDKDYFKCLIAIDCNIIVGFATYFFSYYSWTGKALYIDDLYVKENHRGKSIGTNLLDTLFHIANEENCKKVKWQVSNWNERAIEFYKKRGAVIDDIEINCELKL